MSHKLYELWCSCFGLVCSVGVAVQYESGKLHPGAWKPRSDDHATEPGGSDYVTVMQQCKSFSFCFGNFLNILKREQYWKVAGFNKSSKPELVFISTITGLWLFVWRWHSSGFYEQHDVIAEQMGAVTQASHAVSCTWQLGELLWYIHKPVTAHYTQCVPCKQSFSSTCGIYYDFLIVPPATLEQYD